MDTLSCHHGQYWEHISVVHSVHLESLHWNFHYEKGPPKIPIDETILN
jgi:hypothetical protein